MRTIKLCCTTPHRHTTLLDAIHRSEAVVAEIPRRPRPAPAPKAAFRPAWT